MEGVHKSIAGRKTVQTPSFLRKQQLFFLTKDPTEQTLLWVMQLFKLRDTNFTLRISKYSYPKF